MTYVGTAAYNPSRDDLLDNLKKYYRCGTYYLVKAEGKWGICTSAPEFEAEEVERYFVHTAFVNQLARVDRKG